jgi:hypothetical protein
MQNLVHYEGISTKKTLILGNRYKNLILTSTMIAFAFIQSASGGDSMSTFKKTFDLKLQYQENQKKVFPKKNVIGSRYLGSGAGSISGSPLSGKVQWDLYEVQGESHCQSDFFGVITTDKNQKVIFHARGAFTTDKSSGLWNNISAVRFEPQDEKLSSLEETNFTMKGTFDMKTGSHVYEIFQ